MATMSVRSTYALDPETAQIIKRLAVDWGVSQAEVIRRAVRESSTQPKTVALSPAEVIDHYRSQALPRNPQQTRTLIRKLRAERHRDDKRRTQVHHQ